MEKPSKIGEKIGGAPLAERRLVRWGIPAPWIRVALEAGHLRSVVVVGTPLDVPIATDETVLGLRACRVVVDGVDRQGHCAIIVATAALPAAQLDEETVELVAEALADALLAEVV